MRVLLVLLVLLTAAAAVPSVASASRVTSAPAQDLGCHKGICESIPPALTFTGDAGEANRVTLTREGSAAYTVRDTGAPLTAGQGCEQVSPDTARCVQPGASVVLTLGDGDDTADAPLDQRVVIDGGLGADRLTGGPQDDELRGGDGPDALAGGPGSDLFSGDGATAADDAIDGGPGIDRLSYLDRDAPLVADLAAGTAGQAGERDALTAIETILGGRGDDRLTGDAGPNRLEGHIGDDEVRGGDGDDEIRGDHGDDVLEGGRGDDILDGNGRLPAGACGDGEDRVYGLTTATFLHSDCERVALGFSAIDPVMSARPLGRTARALRYAVTCPANVQSCRVDVDVRTTGRRSVRIAGAGRSLPQGFEGRISVRLTRAGRRLLRTRCPRLHVVLRAGGSGNGWVVPKGADPAWCRTG